MRRTPVVLTAEQIAHALDALYLLRKDPARKAEFEDARQRLRASLPNPPTAAFRSPLEAARQFASAERINVPPSHRKRIGKYVTAAKQTAVSLFESVLADLLGPQQRLNQELLSVIEELAQDRDNRGTAVSRRVRERLAPFIEDAAKKPTNPAGRPLVAAQARFNEQAFRLLQTVALGKPLPVRDANARIGELAKRVDPPDATKHSVRVRVLEPIWREAYRNQTRFNSEVMLVLADLLHGRPPVTPPSDADYRTYYERHEPDQREQVRRALSKLTRTPVISVVVPAYNTAPQLLERAVQSLSAQDYPHFELCIVDDGSPNKNVLRTLERLSASEPRLRYQRLPRNAGIAGATNAAIKMARGEYIAFMDHDDELAPHALSSVVVRALQDPEVDWVYSDEDRLSLEGERHDPYFKPDFNLELLRTLNYICHFVVVKKSIVDELSGLRDGYQGSQDYEFLLRLCERTQRVRHIPSILYHWRIVPTSVSREAAGLHAATSAGKRALGEHLQRQGITARVSFALSAEYRVRYALKSRPLVSIIVPFKDQPELLEQLTSSLRAGTDYDNYELLLVSNNSQKPETAALLEALTDKRIHRFEWNHPFNYAAINNWAARQARGELLLFLNNDTEVVEQKWLDELVSRVQQPSVGAVAPKLVFPDGSVQHAGVAIGIAGGAAHPFWRLPVNHKRTAFGSSDWSRDCLAVTSACVMLRAELFKELGGFDERFKVIGSDVDLCLRMVERGLRVVYTSGTWLFHHESASRRNDAIHADDWWESWRSYRRYLLYGDPFYNPNLTLAGTDCSLKMDDLSAVERAALLLTSV